MMYALFLLVCDLSQSCQYVDQGRLYQQDRDCIAVIQQHVLPEHYECLPVDSAIDSRERTDETIL